MTMTSTMPLSRRTLVTGGLTTGFLFAFHLPLRAAVNEPVQPPDVTEGKFAPNAFIRIDEAGHTTLMMPQVEMGQGVYTAVAMILAEELDADLSQVSLEHAPPNDKLYGNPVFGLQVTGNSNSIRAWWTALRNAGAGARSMLVQAAAKQWQVEAASCTTSKSVVTHKESGRNASLRCTCRCGEQRDSTEERHAQEARGLRLHRPVAETVRHAGQGQWQGRLRHRCDPSQHEGRDNRSLPGIWRQGRQGRRQRCEEGCPACRRSSCWTTSSPWSAITCGPRRRASLH